MSIDCFIASSCGGRFKITGVSGHPGISVNLTPPKGSTLHYNEEGSVAIQNHEPGKPLPQGVIWFTLHCESPTGHQWHKAFEIPDGGNTPKEKSY
jgi:hypothetical protein